MHSESYGAAASQMLFPVLSHRLCLLYHRDNVKSAFVVIVVRARKTVKTLLKISLLSLDSQYQGQRGVMRWGPGHWCWQPSRQLPLRLGSCRVAEPTLQSLQHSASCDAPQTLVWSSLIEDGKNFQSRPISFPPLWRVVCWQEGKNINALIIIIVACMRLLSQKTWILTSVLNICKSRVNLNWKCIQKISQNEIYHKTFDTFTYFTRCYHAQVELKPLSFLSFDCCLCLL